MYIPQSFREDRTEVLHALIQRYSFGTLVSSADGELCATHLPFLLDAEAGPNGTLVAHLARANPQWRAFDGEQEALAIFEGPHAYISPEWYAEPVSVPTWNYVTVHAYGTPAPISDPEETRRVLEALVRIHGTKTGQSWSMDRLSLEYIEKMLRGIVAIRIPISRLEGKWKLGQNRTETDRERMAEALRSRGEDELARLIEETLRVEPRRHEAG